MRPQSWQLSIWGLLLVFRLPVRLYCEMVAIVGLLKGTPGMEKTCWLTFTNRTIQVSPCVIKVDSCTYQVQIGLVTCKKLRDGGAGSGDKCDVGFGCFVVVATGLVDGNNAALEAAGTCLDDGASACPHTVDFGFHGPWTGVGSIGQGAEFFVVHGASFVIWLYRCREISVASRICLGVKTRVWAAERMAWLRAKVGGQGGGVRVVLKDVDGRALSNIDLRSELTKVGMRGGHGA